MALLTATHAGWADEMSATTGSRSASGSWTAFRGTDGTGIAAADLPVNFGEGNHVAWKTAIHGRGWASPVVLDGQVWLATAGEDGKTMSAVCVDAQSGMVLHDVLLFENPEPEFAHPTNSYASCTPAIEPGRVYLHFGHYGTAALDTATGKVLWTRRDLPCNEFRGPGSSPIVWRNLLIVNCDGYDFQYVVALDKATGKTVWKTDRNIEYGTDNGDNKKAYATPSVLNVDGREELVSSAAAETVAYDPATGQEIWRVRMGGMNAAARPLPLGDLLILTGGQDETSLVALRPRGTGQQAGNIVWKSNKAVPQRPSPILVGGELYMVADNGVATCRDAATGKMHWTERLGGEFWASPVCDGKNLFCCGKGGEVIVIAASTEFRVVATNKFDEGFVASPAIDENALFLRGEHHLYRIDSRAGSAN